MKKITLKEIMDKAITRIATGCRVDGGGLNHFIIPTKNGAFIVNEYDVIRIKNGKRIDMKMVITDDKDKRFLTHLESIWDETYIHTGAVYLTVCGARMPQINMEDILS